MFSIFMTVQVKPADPISFGGGVLVLPGRGRGGQLHSGKRATTVNLIAL